MIPAITKIYDRGGKMPKKEQQFYKVRKMKCPECGKVREMQIEKGEKFRQLYCKGCGEVVIWGRVGDE